MARKVLSAQNSSRWVVHWYNKHLLLASGSRLEEKQTISKDSLRSEPVLPSHAIVSTVEPEPDLSTFPSIEDEDLLEDEVDGQGQHVGFGLFRFRFSLSSFRLDRYFSERRFSIAEAAVLLMTAYIASRGLGVIRQSIFNAVFGTNAAANAYYAAFRLPDFLFNLIAGGALSNALIPVFVSFDKDHGKQAAWRLVSLVFNVMLAALVLVLLVGEFLAPAFVSHILVPGYTPAEQALTASLTRIMLVQPLILALGTVATAVLSSKRQFLLPALSIAVYNVGLIGGLFFTLAIPGVGIYGPTYGVLVAAVCQVAVQIPGLVKQGLRYSFIWDIRDAGLRQVMRMLGPNAFVVAIGSAAFIIDTAFASYLPDPASLAAQHNAYLLFYMPVALLAQAVAQAALPQLSMLATRGHYLRLRRLVLKIVGAALMIGIPTTVVLCVLGRPAIHIIFQHGAFNKHSSSLTALALIGYAVGLPGVIVGELLARTFYSMKDARTPLFTNILNVAVHIGLIYVFLSIYSGTNAIIAIPLANSGASTAEAVLLCLLLYLRLRKKIAAEKSQVNSSS
ncbi:MAG TPA: murein biosynthesis integral membrane protein MurJ [Ktedonobacteraceae bacterium]|nr:murein biosynthesis integral membrane protein MurJ [Ktedonobacteraceae bacterium]